jgi:hypothetical protein
VGDSIFTGNSADNGGGRANASGGTVTVSGSTFTGNTAGSGNGDLNNEPGRVLMQFDNQFTDDQPPTCSPQLRFPRVSQRDEPRRAGGRRSRPVKRGADNPIGSGRGGAIPLRVSSSALRWLTQETADCSRQMGTPVANLKDAGPTLSGRGQWTRETLTCAHACPPGENVNATTRI